MVTRPLLAAAISLIAVSVCSAEAQSPTIEDLMALRDIGTSREGLALSPDGAWLAFFQSEATADLAGAHYELLLIPASSNMAEPRIIGNGGGLLLHDEGGRRSGGWLDRFVRWSPDSRRVAYIAERGGRAELWTSDVRGRGRRVAAFAGDVRDFRWMSEDELIVSVDTPRASLSAERDAQRRDGFRVTDNFDASYSLTPNPDVDSARTLQIAHVGSGRLRTAEGAGDMLTRIPGDAPRIGASDSQTEAYRPAQALFAPLDGADVMCEAAECSGRLLNTGRAGDLVWFIRGEGVAAGDSALYLWAPHTQSLRRLRLADERLLGCSANLRHAFCLRDSPTEPRHVVAIAVDTGEMAKIYEPNPQWARFDLPPIERATFRDPHGNESYAHLVYPDNYVRDQRYPMVIVQYRSHGFLRGGTGGEYPIFPLAARGYFVMSVERPEARDLEQRVTRLEYDQIMLFGDGEERIKLDSLEGLIAQVTERGLIDPDRIAITGLSDGSETLFWTLRDRRLAAAITSTPPTDTVTWWIWSQDNRHSLEWADFAPGVDVVHPWWRHNAPLFYADRIQTPLLMNLPESEAISGMPLYARMRGAGQPIEMYLYPGAYHLKWRRSQLLMAQRRAMAWIDFWLMDREIPDPSDPGRYERWRSMRQTQAARP